MQVSSIRTFIALELDKEFQREIGQVVNKCRQICTKGVKWVEEKNLHITLQFIGSIDNKQLEIIQEKLVDIFKSMSHINIYSVSLELIPARNPRLIWIKCDYDNNELNKKVIQVRELLTELSVQVDEKQFKMHITLGRVKDTLHRDIIEEISQIEIKAKKNIIKEATLYESRLHSDGPEYIKLKSLKFQEE